MPPIHITKIVRLSNLTTAVAVVISAILLVSILFSTASATTEPLLVEVVINGHTIQAELADTPQSKSIGLGNRDSLGANQGMLFSYAQRSLPAFWMKDMRFAIDIIWLDNETVVHIEDNVPPPPKNSTNRLPTYQPSREANFVLEVNAGKANELGLKVGDRVKIVFP